MRATVYVRESKGQAASVERQRQDGIRLVKQRGWKLGPVLGEADKSAAGKKIRPDFERLLRLVESGEVQAIVAWSWERLERNRRDGLRLIEACQEHSVVIALVRGSDIDMTTPAGRMTADILASVARHEIEQKADRMHRALLQAAEEGKPPKRRAFGYGADGMTVHPIEGPAVAEAYAKLLAGGSVSRITRWLNDNELWTTGGQPWSAPGVRKLLRNVRYAGIRTYRGEEIGPGNWPAIVPEEVYRAAVAVLDDPARRSHDGSHARKWLGSALYLCGRCGATLKSGYRIYGNYRRRAYQCRVSKHFSRVAEPVDEYVELFVATLLRERAGDILAAKTPDLAPLRAEAAALRTRIAALADNIELDEVTLARRVKALRSRLDEVSAALALGGRTSALASVAGAADPGQAWLDHPDMATRQAVVRELCVVTLLPAPSGRREFDPETVRISPER